MALIEYKRCFAHGWNDHMNGRCEACSLAEFLAQEKEKALREEHNRQEFQSLTTDGKLNWLFTYLTGIKGE